MEKYEIFKSEVGYRVCGGVWNDCPIIDCSPWYATEAEAQKGVEKMKKRELEENALSCLGGEYPLSFYSKEEIELAEKWRKEIEDGL